MNNILNLILCALMFCLCACLCTTRLPGAWQGQKWVSDPLELKLELQTTVSHYVGAGN